MVESSRKLYELYELFVMIMIIIYDIIYAFEQLNNNRVTFILISGCTWLDDINISLMPTELKL